MARVGVVGGGAMGQWLKKELSTTHEVFIYDTAREKTETSTLEELLKWAEVLIVAVPFWTTAEVLRQIAPFSSGKLVMDISTFKEGLAQVYREFPESSKVATVHPMFGPGASTLRGQKVLIMEIPGREGVADALKFWSELGADVQLAELEKHDYYVSYTIALSYAVGLALARLYNELGEEVFKYGGTSFKYLSTYAFSLLGDPNAKRYVEKAPVDKFIEALKREDLPKPLVDPQEAYRKFYKALNHL
ncbi:MAG: prephenate dehydrogenase [Pyrobaculum sp.]